MHLKQEVVADFLGVCVYLDPEIWDALGVTHPVIPDRVQSFRPEHEGLGAITLPDEYHMLTFVVNGAGDVFVFTDMCRDFVFHCKPLWRGLGAVFGPNSVIHGVAYRGDARSGAGELVLGVFDATHAGGEDLRGLPVLERHQRVHAQMHSSVHGVPARVFYHWLGYSQNCYACIEHAPYTSHQMLVFAADGVCQRVLGPLRLRR